MNTMPKKWIKPLMALAFVGLWNSAWLVILWIPLIMGVDQASYAESNRFVAIGEFIWLSGTAIAFLWTLITLASIKIRLDVIAKRTIK